ncbi:MAG: helix-turn-helix transcriptional regulator [Bacteroidales bacterium]|nr:helix-turn-helix transcriptional regulator [Bacteroidales bacterium]MDD7089045.1 helix-turn-helix transcriptional regulator [Bacteroidales bacterium]MDY2935533.1 helix-turn-helix transcriptional regulator [Candidatus Cryptobacteroides sp.]
MRTQKVYEPKDMMIDLIRDNYNVLQALGSFGINLGFGDKTVEEVCKDNGVDCRTFLIVVNFMVNGYFRDEELEYVNVGSLLHYLQANHKYYLDFQLPFMRKELSDSLNPDGRVDKLIMDFYDAYAAEVRKHMKYEEDRLFPYINSLLEGVREEAYNIDAYAKHHGMADVKLKELKNIIIKYLPGDSLRNNMLTATLYDLYNNEEWLQLHAKVENEILVPVIKNMEMNISTGADVLNVEEGGESALSPREREVVSCLAMGLSNKEIASKLNISINTVITHRKNIAAKLSIHSVAGITIYAIVNNLVDINSAKQ